MPLARAEIRFMGDIPTIFPCSSLKWVEYPQNKSLAARSWISIVCSKKNTGAFCLNCLFVSYRTQQSHSSLEIVYFDLKATLPLGRKTQLGSREVFPTRNASPSLWESRSRANLIGLWGGFRKFAERSPARLWETITDSHLLVSRI
jgi:hypothetical protein